MILRLPGLAALLTLCLPAPAQRPERLPDIDVLYIERTPRYPGYRPDYDLPGHQGVPILVNPKTRQPLTPAETKAIKRWPAAGEEVTFTAHVQNRGNGEAPPWEYAWLIDGREVERGATSGNQAVGKEVTVTLRWKWHPGRHTVKFVADPMFKVRDLSVVNNSREDATDAWCLIWAVDRHVYEEFNKLRNFVGTTSFEDWAQWHIAHMNHLFDVSPTPWDSPRDSVKGVSPYRIDDLLNRPRIRCDGVVVVDNVEGIWDRLFGQGIQPLDAGYDGAWQFGRREDCTEWAANVDWGLIHEWGHQLGLTDLYALDRAGFLNLTPDDNGDPLLIGHLSSQAGYMMHGHGPTTFSPECMGALMTQSGRRRGYYGDYYFSIPSRNALKVLDTRGMPVAWAKVTFWQDRETEYKGPPVFSGVTDATGIFQMPNRPAPHIMTELGYTQHDNPFGQINVVGPGDVFFIKIEARGQTEYSWLDIAEMNLAYWRTGPQAAVYTRPTRIPSVGALAAPAGVAVDVDRDQVKLRWNAVPGAAKYRIYHAVPDRFEYRQIAEVQTAEFATPLGDGALQRYAVTALDAAGKESAFSKVAGAVRFIRPWGIAVTKEGKRYVRDAAYGQAILLRPDGNAVGPVGSVHYHFEGSYDIAMDSQGRLLSAKWGDGYDPNPGFRVQDSNLQLVVDYRKPEGSEPGQFRKPMGIGANSKGEIFVADTANDRIQQFTPDGKFLRVIGVGDLRQPMKPAFDSQDRLYVADSGHNQIAVFEQQPDGGFKLVKKLAPIKEPVSVIVDSKGRVFASANREAGVLMWDADGKFLKKFTGTDEDPLAGPRGLAFDGKGNLLVVNESALKIVSIPLPP